MSDVKKTSTRKRTYEDEDRQGRRFDFVDSDCEENENLDEFLEKFAVLKQQLNDVKGQLSDKDIADWNRLAIRR